MAEPDFRALCAELLAAVENARRIIYHEGGTAHISTATPVILRARAALALAEGAPSNCWLDDEPGLCPTPCVFDDASEQISNCVHAVKLNAERKSKEACKYYRTALAQPEAEGPSFAEIMQLAEDFFTLRGNSHRDTFFATDITAKTDPGQDLEKFARAVLTRWGRPTNNPNSPES